ncbi:MAG: hypothetical protein KDD53_11025, partial [Bdellovibrionales bacterium]|nr:hypothetical protein [Bdellovibrionales bacterium]
MKLSADIFEAALEGDFSGLRSAPKADLHAHAMLSAPFEIYEKIKRRTLIKPPLRFARYDDFFTYIHEVILPLPNVESRATVLAAALDRMISDGVTYTEISFDCQLSRSSGASWESLVSMFREVISRTSSDILVAPELGVSRECREREWREEIELAISTDFFKKVDFYGPEKSGPLSGVKWCIELARANGLAIKAHIGEDASSPYVEQDLKAAEPVAVQHGIACLEHPATIK